MTVWAMARRADWATRAVIAAGVLAALLVAVVPLAFLAGLVLMLLGHVVGGLALFGGSVLAAAGGVVLAGVSGARQLRRLVTRRPGRVVALRHDDYHYQ